MINIVSATKAEDVARAKELIEEYVLSLSIDLSFQNFANEMATFPAKYSPPRGRVLVARWGDSIVGCVALRDLGEGLCEMKRMYVQPSSRGKGLGRALAKAVIDEARRIGYARMRLDTNPSLHAAIHIYVSLGFKDIDPYEFNPVEGARYFELKL